nr:uncharacterized protein LOC108176882 isoform X3 [Oryctolagus cuniculus]
MEGPEQSCGEKRLARPWVRRLEAGLAPLLTGVSSLAGQDTRSSHLAEALGSWRVPHFPQSQPFLLQAPVPLAVTHKNAAPTEARQLWLRVDLMPFPTSH